MESQQKIQVARSYFRMPDDKLPKKLFFGEVKGARRPGCPRSSFNDAVLIVRTVISVGKLRTNYSGETRLALHVPSSS